VAGSVVVLIGVLLSKVAKRMLMFDRGDGKCTVRHLDVRFGECSGTSSRIHRMLMCVDCLAVQRLAALWGEGGLLLRQRFHGV